MLYEVITEYALLWSAEERARVLEEYNSRREAMGMAIVNRDPARPFSHLEVIPGGGQAEHESYGGLPGYFEKDQLYNLKEDPTEKKNLAGDPEYAVILDEIRITSYNVCYTKLLRLAEHWHCLRIRVLIPQ